MGIIEIIYCSLKAFPPLQAIGFVKGSIRLVGNGKMMSGVYDGFVESEYRVFIVK